MTVLLVAILGDVDVAILPAAVCLDEVRGNGVIVIGEPAEGDGLGEGVT